ncbi:Conserved oligomeric Golgi complex subunit 4-like [Homarus americanus]|uniref:Conserved oligomeric Golgi complex subunit 4-like n=1 Tax=Homarus americanus TaxID=6706 RepID=A0A8J5JAR3_HOMAM|nr:Conserved oligomeric Golgi complex subunit 4-like [Homarus americanus]
MEGLVEVDPRKLTSLTDIKKAYEELCEEEVAVAERLEWSVGNRHHLEARLSQLARLVPTLQLSRVVETQARVGDLLDLEGCSGGVATALAQEAESVETWFDRLRQADKELSQLITHKFDEAVKREDMASVQETTAQNLASAQTLGPREKRSHVIWADTVTLLFEGIARTVEVRQPIIETYYGPGHLSLVIEMLQRECDRQAGRIVGEMRKHRRLEAIVSAVRNSLRCSGGKEPRADQPDPRDLDTLLGELTLINARAELYLRFIRRRVSADFEASIAHKAERDKQEAAFEGKLLRSQLVCDMAVIVADYTILEQFYLNESFKKALAMDTVEETANTSSLVDDAFYIVKKSVRRAIASNSVDGVCAMLNHAVTLIETQLAEGFKQTLRKGFPAQGYLDFNQAYTVLQSSLQSTLQAGKINSSTADSDALRQGFLTALNNTETSMRHIKSLHQTLEDNIISAMVGLSSTPKAKLDSCLNDLKSTTGKLAIVGEFGISQLRATAVKPRVKPWVDIFNTTSHDIKEEEFACYEANDPFSQTLMVQVDGLLGSFLPLLTEENYKSLVSVLVSEVAEQLEKALGGLQFDREVRAIVGYLSQVSEWGVREQLTRLTQMATLLNLENLEEVSEYSTTTTWRLTPSEMRKVLQLRVDFKAEEIKRLKL